MAFTVDYSQAKQGFSLIEDGKYECVLTSIDEVTAKSGTKGYKIEVVLRDDIDQASAGRSFSQTLWTQKATGQLSGGLLNAMAKAMRLENGKSYNSIQELFADMILKPFTAEIVIEEQVYGVENKVWRSNRIVKWFQTDKTQLSMAGGAVATGAGFYPVNNQDVPF